jgi:hypothetical protein
MNDDNKQNSIKKDDIITAAKAADKKSILMQIAKARAANTFH